MSFGLRPPVASNEPLTWAFTTPTDEQRALWREKREWRPNDQQRDEMLRWRMG